MKNDSGKYNIFIAYSLNKYTNSDEAVKQESFSLANDLYQLLVNKGYSCFLMSPDNPSVDFTETPSIAKKCDLFLLATNKTIIEKKESGMPLDNMWWYNELKGFMSKKEIGGKPQIAKRFIQSYITDRSISDSDIQGIYDVFQGKNPIRTDEKLYDWIDKQLSVIADNNSFNNYDIKTDSTWDAELAKFWDVVYAPARPSESEINFYRKFFIEKRETCSVQPKALVLGSTRPLIQLGLDENFLVTIIDSSESFSNEIINKYFPDNERIKLINCDWSEMDEEKQLENEKFDIIIGDMSIGNVSNKHFVKTIQSISKLIKEGGYWLGKNLFHFSKKASEEDAKKRIIGFIRNNPNPKESELFAETVYHIAITSCVESYREEDSIEWYKMDFNTLYTTADHICKSISEQNHIDCSMVQNVYKKYEIMHDKNISFYIYDIKDFVAQAQKNSISLCDIWYGSDAYSAFFPLLILKKESTTQIKAIQTEEIEKNLYDICKFFPEKRSKSFAIEWTNHLPSQYYLVRLSKYVAMQKDRQWKRTLDNIKNDIIDDVSVRLKTDLLCSIDDFKNDKIDTEVEYIKNINELDEVEQKHMKDTYRLAILLYLSTKLASRYKNEKSSLYHLVLKKIFEDPLYDSVLKCWRPRKAPWVTAKVCTATCDIYIPPLETGRFKETINQLIKDYDRNNSHNWICSVGSHMDTCALCVEAILYYYDTLDSHEKEQADRVLFDILSTYVLNNNIYETIIFHPIGEYSIKKILNKVYDTGEPYQKKVLGSVAFLCCLLRIINFFLVQKPEFTFEEKYKSIIIKNLLLFWSYFKNLKDEDFKEIGKIDICTVPQILYSLSQALESERDARLANNR